MMTKLPIEMVQSTSGNSSDVVTVEGSDVVPKTVEGASISEVVDLSFDDSLGILTIEFTNGSTQRVKGFPVLSTIPQGDVGLQGREGEVGKDGEDGEDGEDGSQGCTGPQGPTGAIGGNGRDGRDGAPGLPGPRGITGPDGFQGATGATGPNGLPGVIGPPGATGPTGPTGGIGPAGRVNIIISRTDPGPSAGAGAIWVNPDIVDETPGVWP